MGLKPYNRPIRYRYIEVRRSNLKSHLINQKQMSNVQIMYRRPELESDVGASLRGFFLYRCMCCFYLREEKAWKSLARLISEYPLVASALSSTSFSFRYTSFSLFIRETDSEERKKKKKRSYHGLCSIEDHSVPKLHQSRYYRLL